MKIAIAGAGIGGLAAASLLHDQGHDVTLFDQFEAPKPVGSGLVIQPVGQAVLDQIGCGEAVRAKGAKVYRMLGHEADSGRRVLDVWYDRNKAGIYGIGIHRASLFGCLLDAVQSRDIALETAVRVHGQSAGWIESDAGRFGPFDLVVDALGAGSPLSPLTGRALSYGAVWGTVDWPETTLPSDQLSQVYRRADRMIGALPCGSLPDQTAQKAAIFWSLPLDGYGRWKAQGLAAWQDEAIDLWPEFAPFIEQITDRDQMTMARYTHGTLARPFSDGLAIIGDAAHRASPQLGQGANMALLDAAALAQALDGRGAQDLWEALPAYGRARRWHVWIYQAMSWAFTPQYQSDSRALPWLRDRVLFPASQLPPIPKVLTRLVCGDLVLPLR